MDYKNIARNILFGVSVGDALGVPVEFRRREAFKQKPVTDMIGYGTYNLPPGTWSDDSSLTFCLAEALTQDFDTSTIANNFVQLYENNYWTPRGKVFDIGIATQRALLRLKKGIAPEQAGGTEETSNGNGSLMRISPLLLYILDKPIDERFEITKRVSSITHAHIRSIMACFYYLEFARQLLTEKNKFTVYNNLQSELTAFFQSQKINPKETALFNRLLIGTIHQEPEESIVSGGYVVHSLESSIWCLLTTGSYSDAVLKAVNLGDDTDTTAAITGGLAGLLYGFETIPTNWIEILARHEDIENLAERLGAKFSDENN
ncbi:MAG: ADP-ribosylglycohydrolase family protein [Bacteroidetes bacterium]|nr:ADP-ribosylglycohydrolase family protein [Bacteroidota bacterium]